MSKLALEVGKPLVVLDDEGLRVCVCDQSPPCSVTPLLSLCADFFWTCCVILMFIGPCVIVTTEE